MADMKIGHPDPTRVDSISRKKPGNTHLRRIPSWYQDCDALSPAVHDVQTTDSPRDPSAFARPAPAGASAPRYTPSVTKRILVVDDERAVVEMLKEFFKQFQHGYAYEVTAAHDGADATMVLLRGRYDLVVLDMHMPRMGGLELLKQIRGLGVTVPIIMITGNQDVRAAAQALSGGVFAYVPKPFDFKQLDHLVALALTARAFDTLAATCQALGATFVHFSTDYVFDGRRSAPYRESDAPNPLNVYGESKLEGERLALARCERAVIFRVAGLFGVARSSGKGGTNFVETMLRLAQKGGPIRVVADQVLGPSYTRDLAPKVWRVLPRAAHQIYHLTNAGQTSWHGFARRVFELAGVATEVVPVTSAGFGARARRPAYSVLAHANLAALGEDDLRPWDAALAAYVAERASSV